MRWTSALKQLVNRHELLLLSSDERIGVVKGLLGVKTKEEIETGLAYAFCIIFSIDSASPKELIRILFERAREFRIDITNRELWKEYGNPLTLIALSEKEYKRSNNPQKGYFHLDFHFACLNDNEVTEWINFFEGILTPQELQAFLQVPESTIYNNVIYCAPILTAANLGAIRAFQLFLTLDKDGLNYRLPDGANVLHIGVDMLHLDLCTDLLTTLQAKGSLATLAGQHYQGRTPLLNFVAKISEWRKSETPSDESLELENKKVVRRLELLHGFGINDFETAEKFVTSQCPEIPGELTIEAYLQLPLPIRKKIKNEANNVVHHLAVAGNVEGLRFILTECGRVDLLNSTNAFGQTPLMIAAYEGDIKTVAHLLQYPGIDLDATATIDGCTFTADDYAEMDSPTKSNRLIWNRRQLKDDIKALIRNKRQQQSMQATVTQPVSPTTSESTSASFRAGNSTSVAALIEHHRMSSFGQNNGLRHRGVHRDKSDDRKYSTELGCS